MPEAAPQEPTGADVTFTYLVGRVNHGLRAEMRTRLRGFGLSVPEFTAMSILARRPDLSNAQLARRSLVTPQAMIEILAGLERRGLVVREVDPAHNRILRARMTPAGDAILQEVAAIVDALEDELIGGLDPQARAVAHEVLLRAMQRLRSGLPGRGER